MKNEDELLELMEKLGTLCSDAKAVSVLRAFELEAWREGITDGAQIALAHEGHAAHPITDNIYAACDAKTK